VKCAAVCRCVGCDDDVVLGEVAEDVVGVDSEPVCACDDVVDLRSTIVDAGPILVLMVRVSISCDSVLRAENTYRQRIDYVILVVNSVLRQHCDGVLRGMWQLHMSFPLSPFGCRRSQRSSQAMQTQQPHLSTTSTCYPQDLD
jgi:hypothetical protein